jgi:hypothetical protein
MKAEQGPSPAEKGSPSELKPGLKEKATHQLREMLVILIYFCALFDLSNVKCS